MKLNDKRIKYDDNNKPYQISIYKYIKVSGKLKKYKIKRYGQIRKCKYCGDNIFVIDSAIKRGSGHFCNKQCMGKWKSKNRKGKNHWNWKGGRINYNGYIYAYCPHHPNATTKGKGYMMEHRLVMENKIGRYLTKDEIIHHKNGIRDDNRIENLCIVTKKTHDTRSFIKQLQERIRELEKNV